MSHPNGAKRVSREFAKAIIRRKWDDVLPLLASSLRARVSSASLAYEFGWGNLEPKLRQMHEAMTGETPDSENPLDPPRRYELYEHGNDYRGEPLRPPPPGHDPSIPFGWMLVEFLPSEDSEFDQCYNCFLAIVDEDGPRISAYAVESPTE